MPWPKMVCRENMRSLVDLSAELVGCGGSCGGRDYDGSATPWAMSGRRLRSDCMRPCRRPSRHGAFAGARLAPVNIPSPPLPAIPVDDDPASHPPATASHL